MIKKMFSEWRNYSKTVRELSSLTRRELDDIGISRHDIHDIVATSN